jgi:hypothetical protein
MRNRTQLIQKSGTFVITKVADEKRLSIYQVNMHISGIT